jgi:hypothetical protein
MGRILFEGLLSAVHNSKWPSYSSFQSSLRKIIKFNTWCSLTVRVSVDVGMDHQPAAWTGRVQPTAVV